MSSTRDLEAENARLRHTMERCRTVLSNMALENEGAIFNRWPISHEPLRGDARSLLPVIEAALSPPSASEQSAPVVGSPDAWRG